MSLELLREIGNYAGLVAVFVAIVSLTSQIRRHTQSLQSQNYAKALERLGATQARLGTNASASSLVSRGVRDIANLTREERIQFTWIFYEIFGTFEFMFHEAHADRLPAEVWGRWAATLGWWISLPGVEAWWRAKPTPYSRDFSAFVEKCIAQPILDQAAVARWQTFLADDDVAPSSQG
ncbi:MAG: hypothetical protein R2910_09155 [Gemmatimonadales bacterium]